MDEFRTQAADLREHLLAKATVTGDPSKLTCYELLANIPGVKMPEHALLVIAVQAVDAAVAAFKAVP